MEHFPLIDRLHTDVLEDKYGPIYVEVLKHNERIRESLLTDTEEIARTYALTFLSFDHDNREMVEIDEKIKSGGAIGKTFREHGYSVRKNVIDVFIVNLPQWLKERFRTSNNQAKARLSEFYAKKDGAAPLIYGTVLEVYTPDFRPAETNEADRSQDNTTTKTLERSGFSGQEIWDRLGNSNDWSDVKDRYEQALIAGRDEEIKLRKQIEEYFNKTKY